MPVFSQTMGNICLHFFTCKYLNIEEDILIAILVAGQAGYK